MTRVRLNYFKMMKNIIALFAIFLGLSLVACNFNKVPKDFPKKDQMARILADVHHAEATINQLRIAERGMDTTVNEYYHYVLAKHNLTQQKFDTVVSWYLSHPALYQEVYDKVIALLAEEEAQSEREIIVLDEEKERIRKDKLARNVWKGNKSYFINANDTMDRRIPFIIEVDTIEAKGYFFSAFYQFFKESKVTESMLQVIALYADSTMDTISYKLPITHISTKAELVIGLDTDKKILKMEGFLMKHDTLEQIRARINSIEFEYTAVPDSIMPISMKEL